MHETDVVIPSVGHEEKIEHLVSLIIRGWFSWQAKSLGSARVSSHSEGYAFAPRIKCPSFAS